MLQLSDTLFLCFFFAIETYCTSSPTYSILDCKFILSYHINTTETPPDVGGWLGQTNNYAKHCCNSKETLYRTLRTTEEKKRGEQIIFIWHFQRLYLFSSNDETVMSAGSLPLCIWELRTQIMEMLMSLVVWENRLTARGMKVRDSRWEVYFYLRNPHASLRGKHKWNDWRESELQVNGVKHWVWSNLWPKPSPGQDAWVCV